MTLLDEPEVDVDAKRVCLFCKENGHDVTMQRCEGSSDDSHFFCPCCDRLDRKYRGQFHLIEEIDITQFKDSEPDDGGEDGEGGEPVDA